MYFILLYKGVMSMIFDHDQLKLCDKRKAIVEAYRADESVCLQKLLAEASLSAEQGQRIRAKAEALVTAIREDSDNQSGLDSILQKYDLSTDEGIALMCIAEALLRIPDKETVDRLLADKLTAADWSAHAGKGDSLFANAVTWSLMLTGKIYSPAQTEGLSAVFKRLSKKSGGMAVRPAVRKFMEFLGRKFVMGENINEALKRAKKMEKQGYRYSYDMLGEAARTDADAERYYQAYEMAIDAIGQYADGKGPFQSPGISIKLSALHPRYEVTHRHAVMTELVPRVKALMLKAKHYDIGLTIDAEEANRLDLSLDVIAAVFSDSELGDWQGFGLAVQSYQKRAPYVLDFLADLARQHGRRFKLRLIKGAYWDYEIKNSQELGLSGYPVFTRKNATDVSFIACAKKILANIDAFYPQFATHNVHSIATIIELAGSVEYEFQCLHGMGQKIYDHIVGEKNVDIPCRIYAPVGSHEDLLGYLMRRLLENGANTSFINLITDTEISFDVLLRDPMQRIASLDCSPHPHIPLPANIYGDDRMNAKGVDLSDPLVLQALDEAMTAAREQEWTAQPMVHDYQCASEWHDVTSPCDHNLVVGKVRKADEQAVDMAFAQALDFFPRWDGTLVTERAACLERMADLLEERMSAFMMLACYEAGKTLANAVSEIREAIDFCRYYADRAKQDLAAEMLPGPTGELNELFMHGRGVMVCISPWNFPLAIFLGQISAALVSGNCVIAKPAEQTPLIAAYAVKCLHEAGIPTAALQLLPGKGSVVGKQCIEHVKTAGVMFTGSTETARFINQSLASKDGPIVPLVAETGGMNAMIIDSSALPEQVTADVIYSAFDSAGQRCSALRVLFVQEDIADKVITMLTGAMARLTMDDSWLLHTDVGPVIDDDALQMLHAHREKMMDEAKLLYEVTLPAACKNGNYFAPCAFELTSLSQLEREVFGPILHVIRYKAKALDDVIQQINDTGYGLTLGIHSRINQFAQYIIDRVHVGNIYVNRNQIGAVVGVQPFGGEGLSGTGPKAGGPHYLFRLCAERVVSVNTTAAGGNASLLTLGEEDD